MDFLQTFILVVAAAALFAIHVAHAYDFDCLGAHSLRAPEIRIIASVRTSIAGPDGTWLDQTVQVHEYYSNQQQRARLELHPIDRSDPVAETNVVFYFDHLIDRRLLKFAQVDNQFKCDSCDVNNLAKGLFGQLSKIDKLFSGESWTELGTTSVPEHIVGLTRILFLIDQKKQQLAKASSSYQTPDTAAYEYNDLEGGISAMVHYAKSDQQQQRNDLPNLIHLWKLAANWNMRIHFYQATEINREFSEHSKELDLFSFPVGHGCSSAFSRFNLGALEWFVNPEIRVASYEAKVVEHLEQANGEKLPGSGVLEYERFVAYDLVAKAMRVDTIQSSGGRHSTDIYDFNRNHIYNILHESGASKHDRKPAQQCIGLFYQKSESYMKFIDFHLLIQMGRATVRGLECVVFEQVTRDLPPALFTYLNYRNSNGVYFKRAFEQTDEALNDLSEPYTVVYYFASQNFEESPRLSHRNVALGPLLQVDVYMQSKLRFSFQVSNFVYQLMDASNGDEQVDLFALGDRCTSAADTTGNHAQVTFELHYKPQPDLAAGEVAQQLGGSMPRNKAIIRAITGANDAISATEIYDVESSLDLRDEKQLVLKGTCRFARTEPVESVVPRVVGAADFWSAHALPHTSHEDCFWQAARRRQTSKGGKVLFVACRSFCAIDDAPISKADPETKKVKYESEQFIISNTFGSESCAVMLVEAEVNSATATTESPLKVWQQVYKSLKGKSWDLALPDEDETNRDKRLMFDAVELEISNDGSSASTGQSVSAISKHLEGVGLTGPTEAPARGQEMSFSVCHSTCMANMSCNSFSVCVSPHEIQCVTSPIDFLGDPEILSQIEQKRREVKADIGASRLIEVKTSDLNSQESTKLKIDPRCKLHKKVALELFRLAQPTQVELKESTMRSVDSPAQCAELCLKNNLLFLEKMSELTHQIVGPASNRSVHRDRLISEYTSNLSLWCSSFRYLSLLEIGDGNSLSDTDLAELLPATKLSKAGLCSLMRPITTTDSPSKDAKDTKLASGAKRLEFKQYRFVYTSLYEAHYGRRLTRQPVDKEMETVRLWATSAETCARACFLQTNSLRPWCKSFDFIEKPTKAESNKSSSYCVLNSLALSDFQADENSLQSAKNQKDVSGVWHYEPKGKFSVDSLAEARAQMLAELSLLSGTRTKLNHLGFVWLFACVLAALVCSSWFVVVRGDAILASLHRWRRSPGGPSPLVPSRRIRFQLPDQIDLAELHD